MAGLLGALSVKVNSMGVSAAASKVKGMQGQFAKMSKSMQPRLARLTQGFKKFGLIATGAMGMLIASSPLLRAKMEVLNVRIQELVRSFEGALVPAIELVTDVVEAAIDWWNNLPEPLQQAIIFGMQVVVMLGLLALAWVAVSVAISAAMSPIILIILAIAAAAALLFLAWSTNFLGIRDITKLVFDSIGVIFGSFLTLVQGIIGSVMKIFEGIITFFTAIFSGDLEGALKAIQDIFEGAFEIIISVIMWPLTALNDLIKSLTGVDILGDIMEAGKAIIEGFIKGAQKAIEAAGQVLTDVLNFVGDFLGGSLPERGPLMHVVKWGEELGEAYTVSIAEGISGNISTIDRSLHIDRLDMTVPGADMETSSDLFSELNQMRKATSW